MTTSNLTDRVTKALSMGPYFASDVWDVLGDEAIRQSDVSGELYALCNEGTARRCEDGRYCLVEFGQAVAS